MTLLQALLIALLGYLGSIYGTFLLGDSWRMEYDWPPDCCRGSDRSDFGGC